MRRSILVVDDDESIRRLVFRLFRDGYDVRLAQSGVEALRLMGESPPDVVLLDVFMPHMDGLAVLRSARQVFPGIKVLMVSAETDLRTVKQALDAGAHAYLTKPFDMGELLKEVRRVLAAPLAGRLPGAVTC